MDGLTARKLVMVCIFLLINISFTVLDEFLMECCLVQKAGNMHLEMCLVVEIYGGPIE